MATQTAVQQLDRQRAALYLQALEDARAFARWAERAYSDAVELAPDRQAVSAAVALRSDAAKLRRTTTSHHQSASGRFNPKRVRRVMIDTHKRKD